MTTILEARQKYRWLLLWKVYETAQGRSDIQINMYDIGSALEWEQEKTEAAFDYLQGEGLLRGMTVGGGVALTHQGIGEVQAAKEYPDTATLHFPAFIINTPIVRIEQDKAVGEKASIQIDNSGIRMMLNIVVTILGLIEIMIGSIAKAFQRI
jgi:hypothetical protein